MPSDVQIRVGGVAIGGGAPVVVQSMTLTPTRDVEATTAQIAALASAGCEVVRCAVPKTEDAEALARIVRFSPIPVIADIHFNASLALKAIEAGVAAVRINPGNIGGPDKVALVVEAAKKAGIPMRIGANSGSLPKHLHELAQEDQAEALVAAALEEVELLEKLDYRDFKISVKSTHVPPTACWPPRCRTRSTSASPRRGRPSPGRSRAPSAWARCSPTGSATRSASPSPPTRSRRSRPRGRSSRRSACASAAP
jgi:(E)-4-hydroxy-3-methylbut-2-enyl-diphosphate synthase